MATLHDSVNASSPGVTDGELLSAEDTPGGAFIFHVYGTFKGAVVNLEVSTKTGEFVRSFTAYGPAQVIVNADAATVVRSRITGLVSNDADITATTGSGNA